MVAKVGINGFGRIGRIVSRACLENSELQLSVINDPAISTEYICYLIKFDSTHGKFRGDVSHNSSEVIVNGNHIKVYHDKSPSNVPWDNVGVQYVVEASGMFTNYDKAKGHLDSKSVKRVIVTAPSVDVPMVILGVNDNIVNEDMKVISCGSSTLYCLAPIVKLLVDNYGIEEGFVTSIHAMTPSLKPLDGLCLRGRHWREHRGIHQNIIPATTGACKALGKILPQVKDKLSGLAFRVPIVNVSVLDLTIRLTCGTTLQDIVKTIEETSETSLRNIIRVSNEESVSSDFVGETHSCIFDEDSSLQLKSDFFKIICWYENEYSYACRVIDTINFCEKQKTALERKLTNVIQKHNVTRNPKYSGNEFFVGDGHGMIRPKIIPTPSGSVCMKLSPPSELTIKKPSPTVHSFHCRETKKNELFRIWNDTDNSKPKQNRSAFFQSCTVLPPKNISMSSAQERLENVKRQFSKMVNITENLLKSNQSSFQSTAIKPAACDIDNDPTTDKTSPQNSNHDTHKTNEKQPDLIDDNAGSKNKSLVLNNNCKDESTSHHSDDNNNTVGKICIERDFKDLIAKFTGETNSKEEINNLDSKTFSFEKLGVTKKDIDFKQRVTKTINTLIEGLAEGTEKCVPDEDKVLTVTDNSITGKELHESHIKNNSSKSLHSQHNFPDFDFCLHSDEYNTVRKNYEIHRKKEKRRLNIVDNELRKRNIVLIDKTQLPKVDNYDVNIRCEHTGDGDERGNNVDLPKKILRQLEQNLDTATADIVVSREMLNCPTPDGTLSTVSNFLSHNKQDIYDKLDSASGSDSDNSFEIKERKSQIIQITDLTNSLEDLVRLDKICRIIEISDDLSDQLFSTLDHDRGNIKSKKWSFRDLCERIKLDEFCNKVFGGT